MRLGVNFRQQIHPANLRGHAEFSSKFLYPDDRCLAAYPASLSGSEFRRKDQYEFDFASWLNAGWSVEKNAAGADIAGLGRVFDPFRSTHSRRHTIGYSAGRAAFTIGFHGQVSPTLHQRFSLDEWETQ